MRVALLTNFVPPYRIALYEAIARDAGELRVFVDTQMEANRDWAPHTGSLDVVVQRGVTLHRTWGNELFTEAYEQHIPYDTVVQLRRFRPDAIVTGELGARSVQAVAYARLTRTPVVLWATLSDRIEQTVGSLLTAARRVLVRQADAIIVNGESGARYMRGLGVTDDKLLRVPYSTDMRALLELPLAHAPGPDSHMLYVGAMTERKGVQPLFDGIQLWAHANPTRSLRLTMVGNGPMRPALQGRELPSNVSVTWAGTAQYDQLPTWYASADIFVFPSLADEWGLVVNEALAAGLPVIGSIHSQAVEELVRDGENGWTFHPDDARVIAGALERALATDAGKLQQMRSAARAAVRDITPEATGGAIVARLRELVR